MGISLDELVEQAQRVFRQLRRDARDKNEDFDVGETILCVANAVAPRDNATLLWLATEHPELLNDEPEAQDLGDHSARFLLNQKVYEHIKNALREHAREKGLLR